MELLVSNTADLSMNFCDANRMAFSDWYFLHPIMWFPYCDFFFSFFVHTKSNSVNYHITMKVTTNNHHYSKPYNITITWNCTSNKIIFSCAKRWWKWWSRWRNYKDLSLLFVVLILIFSKLRSNLKNLRHHKIMSLTHRFVSFYLFDIFVFYFWTNIDCKIAWCIRHENS